MKKLITVIIFGIGFSCFIHRELRASEKADVSEPISFFDDTKQKNSFYSSIYAIGRSFPEKFFENAFWLETNPKCDLDRWLLYGKVSLRLKLMNPCLNYYAKNLPNLTSDEIKKSCSNEIGKIVNSKDFHERLTQEIQHPMFRSYAEVFFELEDKKSELKD